MVGQYTAVVDGRSVCFAIADRSPVGSAGPFKEVAILLMYSFDSKQLFLEVIYARPFP